MATIGTAGKLGSLDIHLAEWVQPPDQAYQRRYVPVEPASRTIIGAEDKIAPDTTIAEWHITDWSGGEGKLVWDDTGFYRTSDGGVVPAKGGGLQMGAYVLDDASDVVTNMRRVFRTGGSLFTMSPAEIYEYAGGITPVWNDIGINPDSVPISLVVENLITDTPPLTIYWYTNDQGEVHKADTTPSDVVHDSSFTGVLALLANSPPVLRKYRENLYALWGNDLWLIDKDNTDSASLVADIGFNVGYGHFQRAEAGLSASSDSSAYNRAAVTDVGIFWVAASDEGAAYLVEYNEASDAFDIIGTVPSDTPLVDSTYHGLGFFWVSYRVGDTPADVGNTAYLYAQDRSGVTFSVIGPFEARTSTLATNPILIAGIIENKIVLVYGGYIHTYNVSTGAISKVGIYNASATFSPSSAAMWGDLLMICNANTRLTLASFSNYANDIDDGSDTRYLYTGAHDFGYHGLNKLLLDITVDLDEELDTNEQVIVGYRADGGSWTDLQTMTSAVTSSTKHRTVSDDSTSVTGKQFEFRIAVRNSAGVATSTPRVVRFSARAASAEDRIEWILQLDAGDDSGTRQAPHVLLDALHTLKDTHAPVLFQDPWQNRDDDGTDDYVVTVEEMFTPPEQADGDLTVTVRLRATATI